MRILTVVPFYPPDSLVGAWISTHEFLRGLVRRGHEVDVVRSFARNGDYELDGVRVHASGWAGTGADVVVSHLGDDNQGAKLAYGWGVPSVRMVHGRSPYPARHLDRYPTDLAVFPSAALRDEVGWGGESIVAHPPIEPSEYATEHGDLVTIVNLYKHKGGKLFWVLARSMRDTEFLAVRGAGPQEIHQAPNVEVIPTTGDLRRRVYGRTRLLLVPSRFESFGRVAIEAACSGIPTIAHPSPGMREALGDAATWVRRTAPSQWVDAIRRLSERDAWVEASVRALELAAGPNPEPSLNGLHRGHHLTGEGARITMLIIVPSRGRPHKIAEPHEAWARRAPAPSGQKYGSDCDSLNQCRALGSERFKDEIEAALRRKIRAGKAGARARRPEKQS